MATKSYAHMIESAFMGHPKAHRTAKAAPVMARKVVVEGVTGFGVGGVLGAIHAAKGLDLGAKKNIPVDAVLFGVLGAAAIVTSASGYSDLLADVAVGCGTVYGFRVAKKMAAKGQLPQAATSRSPLPAAAPSPTLAAGPSAVAAGEFGMDPVMRAAELANAARRMP